MTTDADRAELIEHINNLAVIWGEVTLASGRSPCITSISGG